MEFRELKTEDVSSLLALYAQLDENNKNTEVQKLKAAWQQIENDSKITCYGAVDNGKVVATCCAFILPNITASCRPLCLIENVVTDERYRKRGLGKKLIEMAICKAKENGCYKVMLQSGIKRTQAHAFYEKLGFDSSTKKAFDLRLNYN
ncbi:GNAT family N-acetyltransferase [Treponema lecithinolyticum]